MTDQRDERCETCRYFQKTNLFMQGYCRRNPPIDFKDTGTNAWAIFQLTMTDQWCGEYQPRQETTDE